MSLGVCVRVLVSVGCGRAGEALFGSALWKFPGSCSVCFPFVFICGGLFSLWRFVTGTNSRGKVAASVVVVARHSPHPHPPSSSRSPIPPPQQPTRFVTAPPDRQRQHVVCLTGSTTAAAGLWVLAPPPPFLPSCQSRVRTAGLPRGAPVPTRKLPHGQAFGIVLQIKPARRSATQAGGLY